MWVVLTAIGIFIGTYLFLFLGWHIPNHLTDKGKPPYYMTVLSVLYTILMLMALGDLFFYKSIENIYSVVFDVASILLGIIYIYTIKARTEGDSVSQIVKFLYALSFGTLIFSMFMLLTDSLFMSIANGVLATIMGILPIPHKIDKILTPPSKESTAWYAVLHKFSKPRKDE